MNKKISVIIPLYNAETVIIRALQSVLNQTVLVDDIIVIDDGSQDNSVNIVDEFIHENNNSNIRIISKTNGGAASARNKGIQNAKNEIIAFLDSDDEWVMDKLEQQLKYINNDDVVLVGGNHFEKRIDSIIFKKAKDINVISLNDILFKNFFQTSTIMTKKSLVLKFGGFDESQRYAEEGKFYYNLSKFGRMIHINKQLVIYDGGNKSGFGDSGLSANINEMEKGELNNIKFAYENLNIPLYTYFCASLFSILKYTRRFYLVKKSK